MAAVPFIFPMAKSLELRWPSVRESEPPEVSPSTAGFKRAPLKPASVG